jgi:hypothetical protein
LFGLFVAEAAGGLGDWVRRDADGHVSKFIALGHRAGSERREAVWFRVVLERMCLELVKNAGIGDNLGK